MIRIIGILITGLLCSFYMFPFSFTFLPIGNTKIYLAIIGLILFIYNKINNAKASVPHTMITISLAALGVSLVSLITIFFNNTSDFTYAKFIIQMWVWSSAAYTITQSIKYVHGKITFKLISYYIIGVCAIQCALALANEFLPTFKGFIDAYIEQGTANLNKLKRMYGIGASLDTAGSRFACALILISYLLIHDNKTKKIYYSILFVFLAVTGNMVARTTSVGMIIGIAYIVFSLKDGIKDYHRKIFTSFILTLLIFIPTLVVCYQISPEINKMLRFAFESFFNLAENGNLETESTNELLIMWQQLPKSVKTWIIGDGYFLSPYISDPYYIGTIKRSWVYYMGTDVGYLRFIFYFGTVGLLMFIYFLLCCTKECMKKFSSERNAFILLLIMNLLLWAKVSTDIFFIFAPFVTAELTILESSTFTEKQ